MDEEEQMDEPRPGNWCMDCGLFPGPGGRCGDCGIDVAEFEGVKEGEYCTKCGKKMKLTCLQCGEAEKFRSFEREFMTKLGSAIKLFSHWEG